LQRPGLPSRKKHQEFIRKSVKDWFGVFSSVICRFHRKWAETIVDEIIASHYGLPLDDRAHQLDIVKEIAIKRSRA
jgi:hypothetical protein